MTRPSTAIVKTGKLCVVICPNKDKFHGENLFVQYIITDKKIYDEPDYDTAMSLIKWHPHLRMVCLERTCRYCKKRGVK